MLIDLDAGSGSSLRAARWWPRFREGTPIPGPAIALTAAGSLLLIPVVVAVVALGHDHVAWPTFATMLVGALVTPLFTSNGMRRQVFTLIGATSVMGAVLLPARQALAVAFVAASVDFLRRRYLPGNPGTLGTLPGFSNIVFFLWATLACAGVVSALRHGSSVERGLLPLLAAASFVGVAETCFALMIKLGWGHRIRVLVTLRSLSIELGLACLGAAAALLWQFEPFSALAVIAPLVVIRQALRLPLLEERAAVADLEREAKERLLELDRMKGDFVALVSHELRTPIVSISGFADLVLEGHAGEVNDLQRQYIEVVRRNAQRLDRLVGDLVLMDAVESELLIELAPIDLARVAAEAVQAAQAGADEAEVSMAFTSTGSCIVSGDHGRLGQVADNLISNAIKYTPPGGAVDVRVSGDGASVAFEVSDNGPGVAPDDQARLFDRFYRTASAKASHTAGSGLGLAIVKTIVEQHGGRVSLTSELGDGATFRVELPATVGASSAVSTDFHLVA